MKILVMRYRFIGDTILTLPFLKALRGLYPDAQIDMLVAPMSGEIIEKCPYVDNFIYFDTTRKHRYENGKTAKKSFFSYVKSLRAEKYDKAYVLKRSFSSAALAFLARIPVRVGFDTEHRGFLLTKKICYDLEKHEADCFLDVLRAEGADVRISVPENFLTDDEKNNIDKILKEKNPENAPLVVVHATATNPGKLWSKENFAEIIEFLINEKNVRVTFTGAKSDKSAYAEILSMIKTPLRSEPLDFCGELTLRESLALISRAKFLIGNDSGNLHMASSVGTPVIGLYGPMSYKKWQALGENNVIIHSNLPCMPCGLKRKCRLNGKCMKDISPEIVKIAADKMLEFFN